MTNPPPCINLAPPITTMSVLLYSKGKWIPCEVTGCVVGTTPAYPTRGSLFDTKNNKLYGCGYWKFPHTTGDIGGEHHSPNRQRKSRVGLKKVKQPVNEHQAQWRANPKWDRKKLLTKRFKASEYKLAEKMVTEGTELISHRGYWYVQRL